MNYCPVVDTGTGSKYETFGDDVAANLYGVALRRGNGTVGKARGTVDHGIIANHNIGNLARIYYPGTDAHTTTPAIEAAGMNLNHRHEAFYHLATVAVHGYEVCGMGRHSLVNRHLATAGLVEYRHLGADAKGAFERTFEAVYILDYSPVSYLIVGDIVCHAVDIHVFADTHIVQGHITYTPATLYAARQEKTARGCIDTYFAGKHDIADTRGVKTL